MHTTQLVSELMPSLRMSRHILLGGNLIELVCIVLYAYARHVAAGPVAVQFTASTCHAVKNIGTADASALSYSLQNPALPPPKPTTCLLLL
jgi:hypothetical protein